MRSFTLSKNVLKSAMANFAVRVENTVKRNKSCLVVGIDPEINKLPNSLKERISDPDSFEEILLSFYEQAINATNNYVAAYKPNIAFFEAYGIPGLSLFQKICQIINKSNSNLIVDAKRGDIGSTAEAYSRAFFSGSNFNNIDFQLANADALTVNPFLGLDTIEPFLNDCIKYERGIFILVKTSNKGSGIFQNAQINSKSISDFLSNYIHEKKDLLKGEHVSGLGAVVGSTYPNEAKHLRSIMKDAIFLVPGYGAQGGSAEDALASYTVPGSVLVNSSRGIFGNVQPEISLDEYLNTIVSRVHVSNKELGKGCI